MTWAQKKALLRFAQSDRVIPRDAGIRRDVAERLLEEGYVALAIEGDKFRAGYAPLKLTGQGRAAVAA
jgi:hypothetical protein